MHKNPYIISGLALLFALVFNPAKAQEANALPWDKEARAADQAYWDAYNNADPEKMNVWLAPDVEFYHDRGGKLIGKKALSAANKVMEAATVKLRREAVSGSVHFYPLRQGEVLYGAFVTGEHRFYVHPTGEPEKLVGQANFSQLMLLQKKQWRIARIFSYEHEDAEK